MNTLVLLSSSSAYIVARASISTKTKIIINFLVLLSQLNAYVVAGINMLVETINIVT